MRILNQLMQKLCQPALYWGRSTSKACLLKESKNICLPLGHLCTVTWHSLAPVWCNSSISAPLECIKLSRSRLAPGRHAAAQANQARPRYPVGGRIHRCVQTRCVPPRMYPVARRAAASATSAPWDFWGERVAPPHPTPARLQPLLSADLARPKAAHLPNRGITAPGLG